MTHESGLYTLRAIVKRVFRQLAILLFERFYRYEWDEIKSIRNAEKHIGWTLSDGKRVFLDPLRLVEKDIRFYYREHRYLVFGNVEEIVLSVCFTSRGFFKRRLISVRPASRQERRRYNGRR